MEDAIGTFFGSLIATLIWPIVVVALSKISKKARNQIWPYWTGLGLTVANQLTWLYQLVSHGMGSEFIVPYFAGFVIAVPIIVWRLVKQKNRIASVT